MTTRPVHGGRFALFPGYYQSLQPVRAQRHQDHEPSIRCHRREPEEALQMGRRT